MRDTNGDLNQPRAFGLEGLGRCHLEAGELDGAEGCLLDAYDINEGVRTEAEMRVAVRTGLVRIYLARGEELEIRTHGLTGGLRKRSVRATAPEAYQ